ncbi:MAG: tetratricopeptide repeat protein, partial [Planctomycetota bacterium]|nr:tetratricopeptide repeat protein [Planctomycetota bacterium]
MKGKESKEPKKPGSPEDPPSDEGEEADDGLEQRLDDPTLGSGSDLEDGTPHRSETFYSDKMSPLRRPLRHARALHRLIPRRHVPGRVEIDISQTVRDTAASGGKLSIQLRSPREKNGHLIILKSDGVTLEPWDNSIKAVRELALRSGAFSSVSKIHEIPSTLDMKNPFKEIREEIRPGRDTLVLLFHDGIGDGFSDGGIGEWLHRQVRRTDPRARIAWIHPWPQKEWRRTAYADLKPRRLENERPGEELVLPVLALERSEDDESGLKALEGWFENRPLRQVRPRALPVGAPFENEGQIDQESPIDDHEIEGPGETTDRSSLQVQEFLDSTSREAGQVLAISLAFFRGFSVDLITLLATRILPVGVDVRHAISSAISSGLFVRLDAGNGAKEPARDVALHLISEFRPEVRRRVDPPDLARLLEGFEHLRDSDEEIDRNRFMRIDLLSPADVDEDATAFLTIEQVEENYSYAGLATPKWLTRSRQKSTEPPHIEDGAERIRMAAEAGDEEAMLELGERILRGDHDLEKDARKGLYWLRKVANAKSSSSAKAMGRLAHWLLEEEIVVDRGMGDPSRVAEISKKEGLNWLRKAAEAEDPHSMWLLSQRQHEGDDVERLRWLKLAADQNHPDAMLLLGQELVNECDVWFATFDRDEDFLDHLGNLKMLPPSEELRHTYETYSDSPRAGVTYLERAALHEDVEVRQKARKLLEHYSPIV